MASVMEMQSITKVYRNGTEGTIALDGIDLSVKKGEFLAIMGPSGSGKSTMMHIMGLLDMPTGGRYLLDGLDVVSVGKRRQSLIRNQEIGFVFQQFNLMPRATVLENLLLPTIYGPIKDPVGRAKGLAGLVGLSDKVGSRSNQLSVGQIQRVAVARALMMAPKLVLADEPTGNLDTKTSHEIMSLFRQINKDGSTVVLITHEPEVAGYADRVITIRDGRIESSANKERSPKIEATD